MRAGMCPTVEAAYKEVLTLPLWPEMISRDCEKVSRAILSTL
jgi:dTDP-4-amino-4,6-dideoxygalactose transaminase